MSAFTGALRVFAVLLLGVTPCFLVADAPPGPAPVEVAVTDSGKFRMAKGNENMTVEELLTQSGITVKDNDIVNPPSETVWKETENGEITIRRYAKVTVTDGRNAKVLEMYDANVGQAVAESGFSSESYMLEGDAAAPLTDGMVIRLKKILNGFNVVHGKTYYYANNEKMKGAIVGDEEHGLFYAGSDGVIDKGYCDGVTVDGMDWNIINGKATPVETEKDRTLHYALKDVARCTRSDMSKKEKLSCAFKYLQDTYLEGVRRDPTYRDDNWDTLCANDLFVYGKGDCYCYGAAFAYMAKGIGCEDCYACNSGGHGWAEVDGLIYDPEWSMHSSKFSYYAMRYDEPCDIQYNESLDRSSDWHYRRV